MNIENAIGFILLGALQFVLSLVVTERIKNSFQKEHSKYLENLKWEQTVKTQAIRISEYLSKAAFSGNLQDAEDFYSLRQMNWELAMLLPPDLYRTMVQGIADPEHPEKILEAIIGARGILLGKDAGDLTFNEIATHGLGFGANRLKS